jgi:hypothetical protein
MDYSTHDFVSVPLQDFNDWLSTINYLRDNWSNGERLYEAGDPDKRTLAFVTLTGFCLVPRATYQKFFSK